VGGEDDVDATFGRLGWPGRPGQPRSTIRLVSPLDILASRLPGGTVSTDTQTRPSQPERDHGRRAAGCTVRQEPLLGPRCPSPRRM